MNLEQQKEVPFFESAYVERKLGLTVLVGKEPTENGMKTHISVSHPHRYPSWDELKEIKYTLYPQLNMAIMFPPQGDYVNVHKNCFHIWEL
jgi:hypothetical protein